MPSEVVYTSPVPETSEVDHAEYDVVELVVVRTEEESRDEYAAQLVAHEARSASAFWSRLVLLPGVSALSDARARPRPARM